MSALLFTNRCDSMNVYFKEVSKCEQLTPERERELFTRLKAGDDSAFNEIVTSTLLSVVTIAKEYQYQGVQLEDLISEGNLGLMEAVRRFDMDGGTCFLTYARPWVRKSIIEALNSYSRPFSITDDFSKLYRKYLKMRDEFIFKNGVEPEIDDIKEGINWSVGDKVAKALKELSSYSLVGEDKEETRSILDECEDANTFDIVSSTDTINRALSTLTKRDEQIIRMAFGIGMVEHTNEEIAEELGIKLNQARELKERALRRLRTNARKGMLKE